MISISEHMTCEVCNIMYTSSLRRSLFIWFIAPASSIIRRAPLRDNGNDEAVSSYRSQTLVKSRELRWRRTPSRGNYSAVFLVHTVMLHGASFHIKASLSYYFSCLFRLYIDCSIDRDKYGDWKKHTKEVLQINYNPTCKTKRTEESWEGRISESELLLWSGANQKLSLGHSSALTSKQLRLASASTMATSISHSLKFFLFFCWVTVFSIAGIHLHI